MKNFLPKFAYITISFALLLMIYFGYLLWFPFKTIKFDKDSFHTIKSSYKQGEQLSYTLNYTKFINKPALVIRSFENEIVFQLPVTQTNNPIGKHKFINNSIKIPPELPTGKYTLKMLIIYKVNPVREISHCIQTNEFEIIK